jgi:GNAT superfamily N-acetyltransferase
MMLSWLKSSQEWKLSIIRAIRNLSFMRQRTLKRRSNECIQGKRTFATVTNSSPPLEHTARAVVESGIRPYPSQWERHLALGDGWKVFARPVRADDEPLILRLLQHVSKEDLRLRFFDSIKEFSHSFLVRLTQLDYARAMAFLAFDETSGDILGVVRVHSNSAGDSGEYAILLRSDLKGRGLGWALMQMIIEYGKSEGLAQITGQILQENSVMLKMCRELGFETKTNPEDLGLCDVTLVLDRPLKDETRL